MYRRGGALSRCFFAARLRGPPIDRTKCAAAVGSLASFRRSRARDALSLGLSARARIIPSKTVPRCLRLCLCLFVSPLFFPTPPPPPPRSLHLLLPSLPPSSPLPPPLTGSFSLPPTASAPLFSLSSRGILHAFLFFFS